MNFKTLTTSTCKRELRLPAKNLLSCSDDAYYTALTAVEELEVESGATEKDISEDIHDALHSAFSKHIDDEWEVVKAYSVPQEPMSFKQAINALCKDICEIVDVIDYEDEEEKDLCQTYYDVSLMDRKTGETYDFYSSEDLSKAKAEFERRKDMYLEKADKESQTLVISKITHYGELVIVLYEYDYLTKETKTYEEI